MFKKIENKFRSKVIDIVNNGFANEGWLRPMILSKRLDNIEKKLEDQAEILKIILSNMTQEQLFNLFQLKKIEDLDRFIQLVLEKSFNYTSFSMDGSRERKANTSLTLMENCINWGLYKKGVFKPDKKGR